MSFISALNKMPGLCVGAGASEKEIIQAESRLGVRFANDYREYLERYGMAQMAGRELTGIGVVDHLDIIGVTQECRECIPDLPPSWYVVEDLGIDGRTVWQDEDGVVYLVSPDGEMERIADGLQEYIER